MDDLESYLRAGQDTPHLKKLRESTPTHHAGQGSPHVELTSAGTIQRVRRASRLLRHIYSVAEFMTEYYITVLCKSHYGNH